MTSLTALSKRVVVDQLFMAPVGVRPRAPPIFGNCSDLGTAAFHLPRFYGHNGTSRPETNSCQI